MFKIDKRVDGQFFVFGWVAIAVLLLVGVFVKVTGFNPLRLLGPCLLHALSGYYCPGCGGTRAVKFLLRGEIVKSFCYHPIVLYAVVLGGWFMISQTIERVSRGKVRIGMHFREIYMWLALSIIIVNCLVKNMALLIWNVDLMY